VKSIVGWLWFLFVAISGLLVLALNSFGYIDFEGTTRHPLEIVGLYVLCGLAVGALDLLKRKSGVVGNKIEAKAVETILVIVFVYFVFNIIYVLAFSGMVNEKVLKEGGSWVLVTWNSDKNAYDIIEKLTLGGYQNWLRPAYRVLGSLLLLFWGISLQNGWYLMKQIKNK
jgi:hypothetical protein